MFFAHNGKKPRIQSLNAGIHNSLSPGLQI